MSDSTNTLCPHGFPIEVTCAYCDSEIEPVVSEGWLRRENRRLRAALEAMVKAPHGRSDKGALSACRAAHEEAEKLLADYIVPATGYVPPEREALARLLCETAPSEEGHSWYLTARPDGPCTAHRSQAARLTGRVFVGVVRAAPREPSPRVAEIRALVDEYEHANAATVATMGLPAGYGVVRLALIRELLDMVESRPVRELSVEGLAAMLDEMPWRVVEETRGDNADAAYWLLGRIGAGVGGERAAGEGEPK